MSKRAAVRLEGVALVVLLALVSCGGTLAPEADHGQADRYRERYLRMRTYGSAEELAEDADAIVATVFGQGRGEPLARGVEVAGPDGATDNHIIVGDWVGMYQEVGEDTFMLLDEEIPLLPELLTLEEVASAVSDG